MKRRSFLVLAAAPLITHYFRFVRAEQYVASLRLFDSQRHLVAEQQIDLEQIEPGAWRGTRLPIVFEGPMEIRSIKLRVARVDVDLTTNLMRSWPTLQLLENETLTITHLDNIHLGFS